jgi:hypothetical protein
MKKIKFYVLVFPFVIVVLLYLCCWHPHKEFIHPALQEFFGGLDLDLYSTRIRGVDSGLYLDGSAPAFYGHSHNNPQLDILAWIDEDVPFIGLFYSLGKIDRLSATLDSTYINGGGETSLNYYLNFFESKLLFSPKHFLVKNRRIELYIWKFDNYVFEVSYFSKTKIENRLDFIAYKNNTIGYTFLNFDDLFEITPQGDTIEIPK